MPHTAKYIAHRVSDFNEVMATAYTPMQISAGGFIMCLEGDCDIMVDAKRYHLHKWDLVVAFPYSIAQVIRSSSDFDSIMIGVGIDFFAQIQIPNKSQYFTTIKEHPSISLTEQEAAHIIRLQDMLTEQQQRVEHIFRGEIEEGILKIILYEVAAIYDRRTPNSEQRHTRDDEIFYTFITMLFANFKLYRSLEYYAERQHITPSHLSKVVKRVSGRRASDWLVDCVVNNIKYRLQDSYVSISQIAEEYHFPNNSFFSQYFKRYAGMTPKEYRAVVRG